MNRKIILITLYSLMGFFYCFGQTHEFVSLVSYSMSNCDRDADPYKMIDRIITENVVHDTLFLEIGFAQNCCHARKPIVSLVNDTLDIALGKSELEDNCTCDCCFTYSLIIKGLSHKRAVRFRGRIIQLNNEKYRLQKPTYDIIANDTFNLIDKYGFKQGIWPWGDLGNFFFYKDSRFVKAGKMYADFTIKELTDYENKTYTEYYEDGRKKKECRYLGIGEMADCKFWDKSGNSIKN